MLVISAPEREESWCSSPIWGTARIRLRLFHFFYLGIIAGSMYPVPWCMHLTMLSLGGASRCRCRSCEIKKSENIVRRLRSRIGGMKRCGFNPTVYSAEGHLSCGQGYRDCLKTVNVGRVEHLKIAGLGNTPFQNPCACLSAPLAHVWVCYVRETRRVRIELNSRKRSSSKRSSRQSREADFYANHARCVL